MSSKRASDIIYYFTTRRANLIVPEKMDLKTYLKKWYFLRANYNKLGLFHDDLIYTDFEDTKEAIRRLPASIKLERDWRSIRAIQLDLNHEILPEEEWTQFEDDITQGRYLQPYLAEVRKEIKERDNWNSVY